MSPEAGRFLAKARLTLDHAQNAFGAANGRRRSRSLPRGLSCGTCVVFERTGSVTKTHRGAHAEFARVTRNEPLIDEKLRRFLPQAYDLKALCDYELGPEAVVPYERASEAVDMAARFISCIANLIGAPEAQQ